MCFIMSYHVLSVFYRFLNTLWYSVRADNLPFTKSPWWWTLHWRIFWDLLRSLESSDGKHWVWHLGWVDLLISVDHHRLKHTKTSLLILMMSCDQGFFSWNQEMYKSKTSILTWILIYSSSSFQFHSAIDFHRSPIENPSPWLHGSMVSPWPPGPPKGDPPGAAPRAASNRRPVGSAGSRGGAEVAAREPWALLLVIIL